MYLLTAPVVEPVTLAELKLAARLDDTRFDAVIPGLIAAARDVAQQETGRQFMQQIWRFELEEFPVDGGDFPIYRATAAAISYWDGAAWQSMAGGTFTHFPCGTAGQRTAIAPALGTSWPALGAIAGGPRVRVDLTAGATAEQIATVPDCVKTYIKALVIQMLDNPGQTAAAVSESSPLLARLLDPVRLWA